MATLLMKVYPGDKVWLKSGSPDLIVMDFHEPTWTVWVAWHDGNIQINEFYLSMLTKTKPTT